jgi:hypothetical protein
VAQDQRVEFLFAAQVSGQEQLQKLISSVDSLRKETEQLKTANSGLASSTDAVIRNGVRYNTALDAQSKALRNTRMGTQQLGMQINDMATSISTGASPIQAFNQQIGQIGYAMSMMQGTAGAVGRFLAGPWSIVVIGAAMGLGFLAEKFGLVGEEGKKTKSAIDSLTDSYNLQTASVEDLAAIDELLIKNNRDIAQTAIQAANASAIVTARYRDQAQSALQLARIEAALARTKLNGIIAIGEANKQYQDALSGSEAFANIGQDNQNTARQLANAKKAEAALGVLEKRLDGYTIATKKSQAESYTLSSAMGSSAMAAEKHEQAINNLRNAYANGKISQDKFRASVDAENSSYKKLQDSMKKVRGKTRTGKTDAEKAAEKELKSIESFMDKIGKVGMKEIPAYQREIAQLEKDFMELSKAGQSATIAPFKAAVESIEMRQYSDMLNKDTKDAQDMIKGILSDFDEVPVSNEFQKVLDAVDELDKSFENIGNAVANSFKGMVTGAMSFRSAMKGIISAVIDELIRLYVVQQIVGVVKGALTSIGLPLPMAPGKAIGGSVGKNRPYMVGEQGPELFIPGGSGTIIPNRNLPNGGGGSPISISVDARGSNDPAAVRAQVQQGILEAAPAIIAAAESRTISSLRRPRLGGVMQ